jgi:hypothetical protein
MSHEEKNDWSLVTKVVLYRCLESLKKVDDQFENCPHGIAVEDKQRVSRNSSLQKE